MKTVAAGTHGLAVTSSSNKLEGYFTKSVNLEAHEIADSGFTAGGGTYVPDVRIHSPRLESG